MAELLKIIGIAFITVICSIIIKNTKPELSFAVTTAGIMVIVLQSLSSTTGVISVLIEFSKFAKIDNDLIKILFKMIAIGWVCELSVGILNDLGGSSVADKVLIGGKLSILIVALPILRTLLEVVNELLSKI